MKLLGRNQVDAGTGAAPVALSLETDDQGFRRLGRWLIFGGFGGFFLWAALAPLDQGVATQGVVITDSKRKTIQHQTGGVVEEIRVREGDTVKAGQVLLRLNPKPAQAQFASVYAQILTARALESRLLAERRGEASVTFPAEIQKERGDPSVAEAMEIQSRVFLKRKAALEGQVAILGENIAQREAYLTGLESQRQAKRSQLEILKSQAESLRALAAEGYYPRNRLQDLERALSEISGSHEETVATIARTQREISEYRLRITQVRQEFARDVESQLQEVQRDVNGLTERLVAAQDELDRVEIKAPVDGMVMGLQTHTIGGVIAAGGRIMDLAPAGESLAVEAKVPPHLIDGVRKGLRADVRFVAFNQSTTPVVHGTIASISADLVPDANPQSPPSYLARVEVTPEGLRDLGTNEIRTGMPVDVIIKTGERTFLGYLAKPFLNRVAAALNER
ncbi:MAG: HlyD family type I secretion periplasmic adaptor subunit [Rhodocyclaceae bacterium]|jgi:protease secretion system membrane fusion protein|nr:HlyD family type I secretion periplasmic adaptor subunit [Rhodocyclaceae bacterium]